MENSKNIHYFRQTRINIEQTRTDFQKFKEKNRNLYKKIYQGARELDLRKKDLIADIQGTLSNQNS